MFEEVKFTRMAAVELYHVLQTTNFDDPMVNRFRYMLTTNVEALKKEIDAINKAFTAPEKFSEYQTKRNEIFKKYDIKDDKSYYEMPGDAKKSLDDEVLVLETEYKDLIDEVKRLEAEKKEFLDEEITVKLYKINIDLLPTISKDNNYSGWDIWGVLNRHVVIAPKD